VLLVPGLSALLVIMGEGEYSNFQSKSKKSLQIFELNKKKVSEKRPGILM
jgi:hypothetical protein